jgi:hypothetical protein
VVSLIEWALLRFSRSFPEPKVAAQGSRGNTADFPSPAASRLSWVPFAPEPDTDSLTDNACHWCYANHQGLV